jgi:predicted RNA-binding protein YlxR (DUF448 family)
VRRVPHVPIRMCLGCGTRTPQMALLRFSSLTDGTLTLLDQRSHRGRSGYLHPHPECWQRFAARGGRLRSLGRNIDKPQRLMFVHGLQVAEHSAMVR